MGWAAFVEGAALPVAGSFKVRSRPGDFGGSANEVYDFMRLKLTEKTGRPGFIGYEAPISPIMGDRGQARGMTSPRNLRFTHSLNTAIEMYAGRVGATCVEIPQQTWRAVSLGYGQAPKPQYREPHEREWSNSEWLKRRAMHFVVELTGITPEDDNMAEAILQLDCQMKMIGIPRPWRGE